MGSSLFEDAVNQKVDNNGKARLLNYTISGKSLSLMTSPLPPFDLPVDNTIHEVSLKIALVFLEKYGLQITSQDGGGEGSKTQGLWVVPKADDTSLYYGYIPIELNEHIKNVPLAESTKNDPIRVEDRSDLQSMRKTKKIAEFLKQYTLYTYSLFADKENFDEAYFVVIPDHKYEIEKLNKKLFYEGNRVMYDAGGYLIANSDDMVKRLLSFLKVQLLTNGPGVLNMKDNTGSNVEENYQSISDFRTSPDQLIFLTKDGLNRWKQDNIRIKANTKVNPLDQTKREAFFYRNPRIRGDQLMIVQNVTDGSLDVALAISHKWVKDRVNLGFTTNVANPPLATISHTVYTDEGDIHKVKGETKETVPVLQYEDETYAALLFM